MSKYNLFVGGEYDSSTSVWTAYENSSGIQDSMMLGYVSGETVRRGVTVFASNDQQGATYSDYSGSLVEQYVNEYSSYLSSELEIENTATLISKEELEVIVGTTLVVDDNLATMGAPAFLYSTSYWTRSASTSSLVWFVNSVGSFGNSSGYSGVRPVVTITSSLI